MSIKLADEIANDCQGILDMLNNDEEQIESEIHLWNGG